MLNAALAWHSLLPERLHVHYRGLEGSARGRQDPRLREKSPVARRLHELRPDWVWPTILRHEFMNVCATYQRAGGFSRDECLALVGTGVALLSGREVDVDAEPSSAFRWISISAPTTRSMWQRLWLCGACW